ncbi:unnamed protein product [Coffea canephora]|uniref:DH200=94 genomic scaffold, scaffold_513 n=1 Tax=Coffea canephora TaxID=49390 RepID=A0A068VF72_COFCA|nr:unnamed protein product [Coffea canephora]
MFMHILKRTIFPVSNSVDLEHNQYRSFQGLTCLMQISTRSEDFVIDTLKLRIHVGPYLREAFKDPNKKKVMHGADRDIMWLQRDFGIYVCNLFDTGQASRVLKLERNSLEYLLHHFCGVTANKEYQNADWRVRPLPHEMLRYAREDAHYLLYIYDLMRMKLLSASSETEDVNSPLEEVYKRSYDVCMQLYEKELLTDRSYLHIYGLQGADLNAQQLAVVAGLCEWKDVVARAEDESTGYVLPNKTLIEIAKQMPLTTSKLKRSLKAKHPYIERNLGSVLSIIRHSMQNAAAFEVAAQQLKEQHVERAGASVQVLKKPSRGFGALLGGSTKRKLHPDIKVICNSLLSPNLSDVMACQTFQCHRLHQEDQKLEEIKSSVNLPFHAFPSSGELLQRAAQEPAARVDTLHHGQPVSNSSNLEDFILLGAGSDVVESGDDGTEAVNVVVDNKEDNAVGSTMDMEEGEGEDTMSLSDLSSSFQKCLPSINRVRDDKLVEKPQECAGFLQFKPFDYQAAKKQVIFREDPSPKAEDSGGRLTKGDQKSQKEDGTRDLPQVRRHQAFPASGNRTATFR